MYDTLCTFFNRYLTKLVLCYNDMLLSSFLNHLNSQKRVKPTPYKSNTILSSQNTQNQTVQPRSLSLVTVFYLHTPVCVFSHTYKYISPFPHFPRSFLSHQAPCFHTTASLLFNSPFPIHTSLSLSLCRNMYLSDYLST